MLLKLLILTTAVLTVTAQKNLAKFGTASQSSYFDVNKGNPVNAVNPPISNNFSVAICTHTKDYKIGDNKTAWWMFNISFGTAYITDISIYYRENFAHRMSGFKLYVANTTKIPPVGHLCYADPGSGNPNITQSIPCYQLGQYIIYYDDKGSTDENVYYGPIVELCYVAINGCEKTFWGNNCSQSCSKNCIDQHCFPGNGSCVWGCNCTGICNAHCLDGCTENRTGLNCKKYNLATAGSVSQNSNSSQPSSQVNDGNFSSCSSIEGSTWIQIDIKKISIGTELFFIIDGMFDYISS
ncbi:unnamed protein product [Mytilus coruscus]|uniref:Fucolectin tachylectin-4 pentraxin-1 domain-containing protein n=1 Tax=Mytilus coruscus TaxID=42192 RepID=A0A6J8EB45_MYTCO|nr:unnamed protein product [Mytilus coruscus]